MEELEIKRIPFMSSELMAARDPDGQIWAGVRWVCEGIGLSEGQIKNERLKIQKDKVLSRSGRNFVLNESGYGNREVLCLKLDYVPLWLAKISITPAMEQENPKLAERLIQFQLHAKDVLAAAFMPTVYGSENQQQTLTSKDYIKAASLVANCRKDRLSYVMAILRSGGFEIPEITPPDHPEPEQPTLQEVINMAIREYGISIRRISEITGVIRQRVYSYKYGSIPQGDRAKRMIRTIYGEIRRVQAIREKQSTEIRPIEPCPD